VTKTTVYIPDTVKAALARRAQVEGRTEAELIRAALESAVAAYLAPDPTLPLFRSEGLRADRTDELLAGFGER
jgi:hypothetical protein